MDQSVNRLSRISPLTEASLTINFIKPNSYSMVFFSMQSNANATFSHLVQNSHELMHFIILKSCLVFTKTFVTVPFLYNLNNTHV